MNKHLIALAATALTVAGCATQPPAPQVAGEDLNIGIAKSCVFTKPDLSAPNPTANLTLSNDGWCAVRVMEKDGQPFQLGLLKVRPEHGVVLIQKLGGETRLEYTPNPRFTGADRFTVALRSRTPNAADILLPVAVTVTAGEQPVAAAPATPAPAAAAKPASRTPARASTPARR